MRTVFTSAANEVPTEDEIRVGRVEVARRCQAWTEIADDFVPRGRGMFVSASTDHVYSRVRGVVFQTASVAIVADYAPYYFTVSADGRLAFYERLPETWTGMLERRARARAARSAPRRARR